MDARLSAPDYPPVHTVLRPRNLELEDSCMSRVEAMIVAYELVRRVSTMEKTQKVQTNLCRLSTANGGIGLHPTDVYAKFTVIKLFLPHFGRHHLSNVV